MEIEKAFKRLLIKSPFYGLFCLSLPKKIDTTIETLCVRQKGINCELCINPDFWAQHSDDEQIALLQHELSHICLQHMFISNSFPDAMLFNVAADMETNSYIENLPSSAVKASDIGLDNGLGTKQYYQAMSQPQQQQNNARSPQMPCNGGQGGSSQAQQPSAPKNNKNKEEDSGSQNDNKDGNEYPDNVPAGKKPIDSHKTWKDFQRMPEAVKQLVQNNIVSIIKNTAEQVEKQRGTIPAELREMVEKLRKKKPEIFNWKAYFRRMLGSIYDVNIKSTRRKESKRFDGSAGIQHRKKVSILVAIDTSGSVSSRELQDFFSEREHIYKAGARITILECDARINKIVEYDGKRIPEIVGRGGTDFNPPVDYYIKHKKDYASLIYFTDGECTLPEKHPAGMVWVITSNGRHQDFPGKTIYIPKDNENS